MAYLKFNKLVFNDGLNLTVRRGAKWDALNELDKFGVYIVNGIFDLQHIVDIGTIAMRFCDLRDSDLEYEHDPQCRSVSGLLEEMKRIHPGFDEREIVTLVYFTIDKDTYI